MPKDVYFNQYQRGCEILLAWRFKFLLTTLALIYYDETLVCAWPQNVVIKDVFLGRCIHADVFFRGCKYRVFWNDFNSYSTQHDILSNYISRRCYARMTDFRFHYQNYDLRNYSGKITSFRLILWHKIGIKGQFGALGSCTYLIFIAGNIAALSRSLRLVFTKEILCDSLSLLPCLASSSNELQAAELSPHRRQ